MREIVVYFDGYYKASGGIEGYITDMVSNPAHRFRVVTDAFPRETELTEARGNVRVQRFGPTNTAVGYTERSGNARPFFPVRLASDVVRVRRKLRYLRTHPPGLLVVQGPNIPGSILRFGSVLPPNRIVRTFADFSGVPTPKVAVVQGLLAYLSPPRIRDLEKEFYAQFPSIVCVDTNLIEFFRQEWSDLGGSSRLSLVQHAVDVDRFRFAPPPDGPLRIGFVARLESSRGIEYLSYLSHHMPDGAELYVIGSGSFKQIQRFERTIDTSKATLRYNLSHEEIADALKRIHVLFNPVIVDGISRATLEAMAVGRPVIMFSSPHRYPLVHGETGFLVPRSGPELVKLVERLTKARDVLLEMGRKARRAVEREYSLPRFHAKWNRVYEQLGLTPGGP